MFLYLSLYYGAVENSHMGSTLHVDCDVVYCILLKILPTVNPPPYVYRLENTEGKMLVDLKFIFAISAGILPTKDYRLLLAAL